MKWKVPIARLLRKRRFSSEWLALYQLAKSSSYLKHVGWFESFYSRASVDGQREPIPWLTYPSLALISQRIRSEMSVFEFGSGNSTNWWAKRVARVVSVEHDATWHERMAPLLLRNVDYMFVELNSGYVDTATQYQNEFDIVVIDGRERVRCARNSLGALKSDGIIIWDNTDRAKYQPGFDFLREAGFRRLDFWGMIAVEAVDSCTSLFYRSDNCFGI